MAGVSAVLWHIEVSHYNEKVRWALDFKAVPHVRRAPMPGLNPFYALAITRGRQRRLPVLVLDGRAIGDSTAIIAALEAHTPDPPLYPAGAAERSRALALEDHFDEELGPAIRTHVFHHTLDDADAVRAAFIPNAGPGRQRVLRALGPVIRPVIRWDFGVDATGAARALERVRAAMDRVEREIQPSGYLVGESFSVADLTAAALFTPLLAPPQRPYLPSALAPALLELREELTAREGGAWVLEMYARHRGTSAEVAA